MDLTCLEPVTLRLGANALIQLANHFLERFVVNSNLLPIYYYQLRLAIPQLLLQPWPCSQPLMISRLFVILQLKRQKCRKLYIPMRYKLLEISFALSLDWGRSSAIADNNIWMYIYLMYIYIIISVHWVHILFSIHSYRINQPINLDWLIRSSTGVPVTEIVQRLR